MSIPIDGGMPNPAGLLAKRLEKRIEDLERRVEALDKGGLFRRKRKE